MANGTMAVKSDVPDDENVGAVGGRIQEALKAVDMTEEEMAKKAGVSPRTFQRYTSGETDKLPASVAVEIARVTGYTVRWIVTGEEPKLEIVPSAKEKAFDAIASVVRDATASRADAREIGLTAAEAIDGRPKPGTELRSRKKRGSGG